VPVYLFQHLSHIKRFLSGDARVIIAEIGGCQLLNVRNKSFFSSSQREKIWALNAGTIRMPV
jgi:hypothetical protein